MFPEVIANNPQNRVGRSSPAGFAPQAPPSVFASVFRDEIMCFLEPGAPAVRVEGRNIEMFCYVANETQVVITNDYVSLIQDGIGSTAQQGWQLGGDSNFTRPPTQRAIVTEIKAVPALVNANRELIRSMEAKVKAADCAGAQLLYF